MPMSADLDQRKLDLQQWVCTYLGRSVEGVSASSDASFRRYFRFADDVASLVAMDAPPEHEDCRAFVKVARLLTDAKLNVPAILAEDFDQGFLLLSDLGVRTWLDVLNEDNADELFALAIAVLLQMQMINNQAALPQYDRALLQRELDLFPDWYIQRHLGLEVDSSLRAQLDEVFELLIVNALNQPQVFVHRDFMPRNLMLSEPNPGVLDFQDAVWGPISYDPICLFKDAFVSWPEHKVQAWLQDYWQQAQAMALPVPDSFQQFQFDCDLMGAHRHLKVIGIFARICHRDGKPRYLDDVPRFFEYLNTVIERQPKLSALGELLMDIERRSQEALL